MAVPARAHGRTVEMSKIGSSDAIRKFEDALQRKYQAEKIPDKGQYVLSHSRVHRKGEGAIDVIVYTSNKIYISAPPAVSDKTFDILATEIGLLAERCATGPALGLQMNTKRVDSILLFVRRLSLDDDYHRMVTVILCDTCNEVVLTEWLRSLNVEGNPLREGIPDKIKTLEKKGVVVVRAKEVENLRELRNRVVHDGTIPHKSDTEYAMGLAEDVFKSVI